IRAHEERWPAGGNRACDPLAVVGPGFLRDRRLHRPWRRPLIASTPVSIGSILVAILLPTVGFGVWMAGHFLRARRAEITAILARGQSAQAQVVRSRRGRVDYRFEVTGWDQPIHGHGRVTRDGAPAPGEHVAIRY